nr:toprim domain-containing protein [Clostridia bacterium]
MNYNDYKARISIMTVAHDLGYRFDKSEGRSQPHFVLADANGHVMDSINIKNPGNYALQGFWRRHPSPGQRVTGDLIDFIKEHKMEFAEYMVARNDIDLVNRVLARYAGVSMSPAEVLKSTMGIHERDQSPFDIDSWQRTVGADKTGRAIMYGRGFSEETIALFNDNLEMIKKAKSAYRFTNLAFPYRKAGNDEIMGYEIRGFGKYKSKTAGSDLTQACWQAYVGKMAKDKETNVTEIHIAESAYDVMSFVELNKNRLNLDNCLFVSTGGQFSDGQIEGLLAVYKGARLHLHFDNDEPGRVMELRAAALANGLKLKITPETDRKVFTLGEKVFSIPNDELTFCEFCRKGNLKTAGIVLERAPSPHKDWNEVLQVSKVMVRNNRSEEEVTVEKERKKSGLSL